MEHLSNHHRTTLREIFNHEATGTLEWRKVRSLLEAVGTVEEEHDGKLKVTVGPETETLHIPHGKEIDRQTVVDLRRMLTEAGFGPDREAVGDDRDRDYGDSRRGKPT